jgi:hypothetical protein
MNKDDTYLAPSHPSESPSKILIADRLWYVSSMARLVDEVLRIPGVSC